MRRALAAALFLAVPPVARADEKVTLVVEAIADAAMFDESCTSMSINTTTMGVVMSTFGIEAADLGAEGRYGGIVLKQALANQPKIAAMSEDNACMLAELFYGSGGMKLENLLTKD